MATDATLMLVHGATARRLTTTEAETVAANLGLIDWTIRRYCQQWVTHLYTYDDAWQDGWFGLCTAVTRWDPVLGTLATIAPRAIGHSVRHGAGIAGGINRRRVITGRVPYDSPEAGFEISLDTLIGAPDNSPTTLGDRVPADVDVEATAIASVVATVAEAAARRACQDHIDRAVLAWILDPEDTRSSAELGLTYARSGMTIRLRRHRLMDHMARAVAA